MAIPVTLGTARAASLDIGGLRVSELAFPPLLRLAPHGHERACVAVVVGGAVEKRFRREELTVRTATVVTMPPGERHEDRFSGAGASIVVVEPDEETATALACGGLDGVGCFADADAAVTARRIARELREPDAVTPLAVEGLSLELLACTARLAASRPARRMPPWLACATEILHDRFADSPSAVGIAAEVGVHPVHLARVFRAHHGVTLGAYVRRLRLEWAAACLRSGDEPLAQVAVDAGFADQSHFTRAFKAHTGLTPGRYRAIVRR
jgi:AraC family transcriptional regulator